MDRIVSPEQLTNPTAQEYEDACARLWAITQGDSQAMRDMRTVYWQGWNRGYEARAERS